MNHVLSGAHKKQTAVAPTGVVVAVLRYRANLFANKQKQWHQVMQHAAATAHYYLRGPYKDNNIRMARCVSILYMIVQKRMYVYCMPPHVPH